MMFSGISQHSPKGSQVARSTAEGRPPGAYFGTKMDRFEHLRQAERSGGIMYSRYRIRMLSIFRINKILNLEFALYNEVFDWES